MLQLSIYINYPFSLLSIQIILHALHLVHILAYKHHNSPQLENL